MKILLLMLILLPLNAFAIKQGECLNMSPPSGTYPNLILGKCLEYRMHIEVEDLEQMEKRLKLEFIKSLAEAKKDIVLEMLKDPEMRASIKEKIQSLER